MKRRPLLTVAALSPLGACSTASRNETMSHDRYDTLPWTIAEGKLDSHLVQVRYRTFPVGFDRRRYPVRLNIFWSMSRPDSQGLASKQEIERLHLFEDRLVNAVETDRVAVLAAVLTGQSKREFVFFAAESKDFVRRLTSMPQEVERYPIELHAHDDPTWIYYERVVPAAT